MRGSLSAAQRPAPEPQPAEWLSVSTVAKRLSLSPATVRRLCASGRLRSVVVSTRGDRRISTESLRAFLAEADQ